MELNARDSEMLRQDQNRFSSEMNQNISNQQQVNNQNIELRNKAKEAQQTERVNRLASSVDVFNKYFEAKRQQKEMFDYQMLRAEQLDKQNEVSKKTSEYVTQMQSLYAKQAKNPNDAAIQTEIDNLSESYRDWLNGLQKSNSYAEEYKRMFLK